MPGGVRIDGHPANRILHLFRTALRMCWCKFRNRMISCVIHPPVRHAAMSNMPPEIMSRFSAESKAGPVSNVFDLLHCKREMVIVPGAGHLFEEPGTLDQVVELTTDWFLRHLGGRS